MDPQPLPEAPKQERIPFDVLFSLVQELTATLGEPNKALLNRIVSVIGVEHTRNLLDEVLAIEEGYPLIEPKSQVSVVLALSVKSVAQERAQRAAKKVGQ